MSINKRVQSILLILLITIIAIGGLLLLMGRMAAPEAPPTPTHSMAEPEPEQQPTEPQETVAETSRSDDNIIATVNDEVITREAWQQATRLDAVMSVLTFQAIPTAEETLDRLVNEIVVLEGVDETSPPAAAEIEAEQNLPSS